MPEIEAWFIHHGYFLSGCAPAHGLLSGQSRTPTVLFDAKLYVSAMIPALRVPGCKTSLNPKGK